MTRRIALVLLGVGVPLLILVAGVRWAMRGPAARGQLVAATIYPLADLAGRVGGDRVAVRTLVPAGSEAHEYEPGPQDVVDIGRARLFVYIGAGFEPWVGRVLPTLPRSVGVVRATAGLPLMRVAGDAGGTGGPGAADPHVWLDPILAQRIVDTLAIALVAADPPGRDAYYRNAAAAREQLAALDAEYTDGLARCERRELVSTHTAFAYLARRYHLQHVGLAGLTPESEPSPGAFARWAAALRARGVRTIFVERLASPRPAETLAREIGARVAVLDPLESFSPADLSRGDDYLRVMRRNLATLRVELGCR